jgi:hypothetical protein
MPGICVERIFSQLIMLNLFTCQECYDRILPDVIKLSLLRLYFYPSVLLNLVLKWELI